MNDAGFDRPSIDGRHPDHDTICQRAGAAALLAQARKLQAQREARQDEKEKP